MKINPKSLKKKLKRCPFCGCSVLSLHKSAYRKGNRFYRYATFRIKCGICPAYMQSTSLEIIIYHWNKRTTLTRGRG